MFKMLIMDADPESIKNFRTYLRMSFPMIKTVYTLSSQTTDVMIAVRETSPDLILCDIRFFGASAQKTIRNIAEMYPEVKFILYGTYNDADYIKRVTEYGVIDYMYRPVKPADFKRCMEHALTYFESYNNQKKAKEQLIVNYKKELAYFRDIFFGAFVSGLIQNETEINRSLSYFGFEFTERFTVFVVRVDHFKKIILTLDETEKHLLSYRINNLIIEKLASKKIKGHSFISAFNYVTCVVSKNLPFEEILNLCDEIRDDIFYNLRIRVTVGMGRTYKSPVRVPISYKEANAAIKYRFHVGHNTTIPIHFVEPNNHLTYRYPIEKEDKLIHAAVTGEYEYCVTLLSSLFEALKEAGYVSGKLLQRLVMGMLFEMGRYAMEQNISEDINMMTYFNTKDVIRIKNAEDAHEFLRRDLKGFCESMISLRDAKGNQIFEDAKAFILSNYYENITLSKLSVKLSTTGEYLNKLFNEREDMSCYEFIVRTRIEAAKRLLLNPDITDELVAAKVGYEDVRHFRGIFKQKTRQSVADYRVSRGKD